MEVRRTNGMEKSDLFLAGNLFFSRNSHLRKSLYAKNTALQFFQSCFKKLIAAMMSNNVLTGINQRFIYQGEFLKHMMILFLKLRYVFLADRCESVPPPR